MDLSLKQAVTFRKDSILLVHLTASKKADGLAKEHAVDAAHLDAIPLDCQWAQVLDRL